jgi:hypothetical protein
MDTIAVPIADRQRLFDGHQPVGHEPDAVAIRI